MTVGEQAQPHVIVCGLDHLGLRTIEELLRRDDRVVAIVAEDAAIPDDVPPGVPVVRGDARSEATLQAAGIEAATAIVLTSDSDLANVHAALAALDHRPGIRAVVRLFDHELGSHLGALVPNAVALSSSALAAPGFVSAALDGEGGSQFDFGGRHLTVRHTGPERRGSQAGGTDRRSDTFAVARVHSDRTVQPLPDADPDEANLVVVDASERGPGADRDVRRDSAWTPLQLVARVTDAPFALRERLASPDRRLINLALVLLVLATISALYFEVVAGLSPLDAVSYAITLLTGASGGGVDIDPANAPVSLKVYGIGLSLLGAALVGVVYALITDAIIGSRLLRLLGRRPIPRRIRDHVIVCGLGSIGYRVALGLLGRGVRVVAVEADESGRFVAAARSLGIPVIVGDARQPEILGELGVRTARALVAATDNDLVNLAAALNTRAIRPELRVVVRLFDPDFALRVQQGLGIPFTRSVSQLAAPAFAAAVDGTDLAASIPVGDRRVVLFARVVVGAGSALGGQTAGDVGRPGEAMLLAHAAPSGGLREPRWRPDPDTRLVAGDELYVAATRRGLADLQTRASA